ncbi:MAG: hypothetical protein ABIV28_06200 [Longimicrobiales bacterium]
MKGTLALAWLELYTRRRRIAALLLFGLLYLIGALTVRAVGIGEHGQVEPDALQNFGGYPLVSAFLLLGWSIGRYPLVIILVLVGGLFSTDAYAGYARLYAATRVRLITLYGFRLALLMVVAFVMSSVLLPIFDFIILGKLSSPQLLVLVGCYILVFGSITALFSVFTRADAWCTLFAWITAMIWAALGRGGFVTNVPDAVVQGITVVLPPQHALNAIEDAFGNVMPTPWGAVLYVCMYAALMLLVSGYLLSRREI